ncbi:MAG TPA: BatD family protein [Kofleriaceae bacterium]
MQRQLALAVLAAFAIPATAVAAVHADLRPSTLAVGTAAELSITTDGEASPPPAPHVDGATVRFTGQMSQTSSVNGATTHQSTFVYAIVPARTGAIDIPPISVGAEQTAPIHASVAAAQVTTQARAAVAHASSSSHAFLSLELPTTKLVVGQAVPIKVHAFFRGGTSATLEGAPHVTADGFTLSELSDKPSQTHVDVRGETWLEATWTGVLAPAKPSTGALVVELPVELAYQDAVRRQAPPQDPMDAFFGGADPFADVDSMFDIAPMQREDVTLRATSGSLAVAELPPGEPRGFDGAVGHFAVGLDPITATARVGEPLELTLRVTGTGNFDRVSMTGADDTRDLRAYPIKASFAPGTAPLTGTKTFTQTIVPAHGGDVTVPAMALPYFDPTTHAYVVAQTAPVTLHVDGTNALAERTPAASTSSSHVVRGATRATLVPLIHRARFWLVAAALASLTALLVGVAWWRRSPKIADMLRARRVDRAIDRASIAMTHATYKNDRAAFFAAARLALQTRLGDAWHVAPDAITAHDVDLRMGTRGETIRAVFEHADDVSYGNASIDDEPLDHWRAVVRTELSTLESQS